MPDIDVKDFESKVVLRNTRIEDFDALVALQLKCFPGMKPWAKEQIESQVRTFHDGQFVIEVDEKIVASSSCLVVDSELHEDWHDWKKLSDSGFIRNHDPNGDTLYGIEIMVDPEYRGMKLARRLYHARKQLCVELNKVRIVVGGRIPGYAKHAAGMTAREYVQQVMDRNLIDPVLTVQLANGFVLKRLIPNYMPGDDDSKGYATYLEWINLDYSPDVRRRLAATAPVRICVVQYQMRSVRDFSEFESQCRFFIDVASGYRSDFVVFPELLSTQLLSMIDAATPAQAARKLAEYTPQVLESFAKLAIAFNINIIGGSHFVMEADKLLNVAYLFRRDGTIGKQPKLHITPSERHWWGVTPGNVVEVFDTDRGRINIQICYDIEFPELTRIAAGNGADIIFVPYNTDVRSGYLRVRYCAQARCVENHVFVATSGCTGNLPFVDNADVHYSVSSIFTPSDVSFDRDGVAAECTPNVETVVIHDLDLEKLRRHRRRGSVTNWKDRRVDLYRVRYADGSGDGSFHEI
jgi:predicted amidohydrolase/ribosomal protein S18 acetylase RimI-like enzyme